MKIAPFKYFKRAVCNFGITGLLITTFGIVMAFYGFPKIIKDHIAEQVALENGTEGYEMWLHMPIPFKFKVYIFNVTNPEEVTSGGKLKVEEIGPYVYDEFRERNVLHADNDTVTFEMKKIFRFNAEESSPLTESDVITTVNVALLGIVISANKLYPAMLSNLNKLIPDMFNNPTDPFIRETIGDILFNGVLINCSSDNMMVGAACGVMKSRLPPTIRVADDPSEGFYFSMLHHMNDTYEGPYTIAAGIEKPEMLGNIVAFDNETELDHWEGKCNDLRGTDTTIFAPIDEANYPKKLYIFQPDVCRVMYAEYISKKTVFNLQAYRYEATKRVLGSNKTNPDNKCFCPENWSSTLDGCSLDGIMSLEACQGAPVLMSFPHFYLGDPILGEFVESGLHPNKEKHGTFVDIEPKTGAALRGAKRIQFNIELRKFEPITVFSSVSSGIIPIMWVEEGAEVNGKIKNLLKSVYDKIKFVKVSQWIIVAIGIILILAAYHQKRKGHSKGWTWTPNRVEMDLPTTSVSSDGRPAGAQKNGRIQIFNNQTFSNIETVAHK